MKVISSYNMGVNHIQHNHVYDIGKLYLKNLSILIQNLLTLHVSKFIKVKKY